MCEVGGGVGGSSGGINITNDGGLADSKVSVEFHVKQMVKNLIPELLERVYNLRKKEASIDDSTKDVLLHPLALEILEAKLQLLHAQTALEFNKLEETLVLCDNLETAVAIFEKASLNSLMI